MSRCSDEFAVFCCSFSFPMGSCAGCSSPGAIGRLPSYCNFSLCLCLTVGGLLRGKRWFGGKRRWEEWRKVTVCKTVWGFQVLSYSCSNCSCMCGHCSKWLNLLQFNPPVLLSWTGASGRADQTSSSWQLNPYPFMMLVLKNKKKNLKAHTQFLLGGLGGGMMPPERKRRGGSSSFGMFSKPSGCRMWGKCEMQGCLLPAAPA